MKPRFPSAVLIGLIAHLAGTPLQADIVRAIDVCYALPRHSRGGGVGARHATPKSFRVRATAQALRSFCMKLRASSVPTTKNCGRSRAGPCSRSPSCRTASGCRRCPSQSLDGPVQQMSRNASCGPNTSARMLRDHHPSRSVRGWPERLRKIGPIRSTGREAKSTRYTRSVGLEKAALAVRCTSGAGPLKLRKSFRRSARPQRAAHECLRAGGGAETSPRAVWTRKRLGLAPRDLRCRSGGGSSTTPAAGCHRAVI